MNHRLRLVQWIWLALLLAVCVRLVVAANAYLLEVHVQCSGSACPGPPQLTPHGMHQLESLHIPLNLYALAFAAISIVYVLINCFLAGILLWQRFADRMAVVTAFTLTLFSGFALGLPDQLFKVWAPVLWAPTVFLGLLGTIGMLVTLYLFPDGRLIPRWPAYLLALYAVTQSVALLDPSVTKNTGIVGLSGIAIILSTYLAVIGAQIYRYRYASTPLQRDQTKWVVYGISVTLASWIGILTFFNVVLTGGEGPLVDLATVGLGTLVWLIPPGCLAIAVLRYRLWEIDVLINRTLVYGSLTITLAALYIGGVVVLQATFRAISGQSSGLAVAVATLIVAGMFNPWRRRLQAFIDRRFYRRKYNASRVLESFSTHLREGVELDRLSVDIVAVLRETVQPASVSVWLRQVRGGPR